MRLACSTMAGRSFDAAEVTDLTGNRFDADDVIDLVPETMANQVLRHFPLGLYGVIH